MACVLITGMSGTGKSSALAELARRGHAVVDTDEPGWTEWVKEPSEPGGGEWLWLEAPIARLLDSAGADPLFVSGCVRNQGVFYDRFAAIVLLSAPLPVILDRVATRATNDYGKAPVERRLIEDQVETVEPLLRAGATHEIDATRPLDEVVAELLGIAGVP